MTDDAELRYALTKLVEVGQRLIEEVGDEIITINARIDVLEGEMNDLAIQCNKTLQAVVDFVAKVRSKLPPELH